MMQQGEGIQIEGNVQKKPVLIVTKPAPQSKILYHTPEDVIIPFSWTSNDIPEDAVVTIVIAADKNFSNKKYQTNITDTNSVDIPLPAGTYYWQVMITKNDEVAPLAEQTGKMQIIQSLPPELVVPIEEYEYSFRTRKPAVRHGLAYDELPTIKNVLSIIREQSVDIFCDIGECSFLFSDRYTLEDAVVAASDSSVLIVCKNRILLHLEYFGDYIIASDTGNRSLYITFTEIHTCLNDTVAYSMPKKHLDCDSWILFNLISQVDYRSGDSVTELVNMTWVYFFYH